MEIVGLEPRRSDLARGILLARSSRPLDAAMQKALWDALSAAGVTEKADEDADSEPDRHWHAAPWLPPAQAELDPQRLALEATAEPFGIEAIWLVKVETGVDGIAWLELAEVENAEEREPEAEEPTEVVDGVFDEAQEVIYAAPDAPPPAEPSEDDLDEGEDEPEDLDELEVVTLESHWRNGAPPLEHSVPFPIERYPEIIDDYDWESFGVAIKLAGSPMLGEESVVNAFFALWLSAYQDERSEEFEPFQRADVVHDRKHRSALMWAERFTVPATASDQVHFLLWIIARLHEVLPIAWARFEAVDDAVKSHAQTPEGTDPFVLAGNPFADRFQRQGEEAALSWAVAQSAWSRREIAGMLVEVALEHDPDNPTTAAIAERLLRRAQSFDVGSDAAGYLTIVLVRQGRLADAITLASQAPSRDVRLLAIGEIAEHAPNELAPALDLLDDATLDATEPEELAELTASVARHAPHRASARARDPAPGVDVAGAAEERRRGSHRARDGVEQRVYPCARTRRLQARGRDRRWWPALRARESIHLSLGGVRLRSGRRDRSCARASLEGDRARVRAHREDGDRRRPRATPLRPALSSAVQRVAHATRRPELRLL